MPNRRAQRHSSLLNSLFNKWCSDKGTYWLSKHNYGAAYDSVLGPRRAHTLQMLELGVGDETAGSLNAWREYFPRAHLWIADIDTERFRNTAQFAWASRQKRRHGCFDDADAWRDPRVHALFGVDSSNFTALRALPRAAGARLDHRRRGARALAPGGGAEGQALGAGVTHRRGPHRRRALVAHGAAAADQLARVPTNNWPGPSAGARPPDPFLKRLLRRGDRAAEDVAPPARRRGRWRSPRQQRVVQPTRPRRRRPRLSHQATRRARHLRPAAAAARRCRDGGGELKAAAAPAVAAAAPAAAAAAGEDDDDADDAWWAPRSARGCARRW